jgi:hypothetical protein
MPWAQSKENFVTRMRQPWFGGGLGTILAIGLGICMLYLPVGKGLRDWSYDLPF